MNNEIKNGIIHCHSEYSKMDSAMSVETLLRTAVEHKAPAVVLTDHGTLSGTYPLMNAAAKINAELSAQGSCIKAIPGVEAYVEGAELQSGKMHMVLIPCNYTGYRAISKAVTEANENMIGESPCMSEQTLTKYFGIGSEGHGNVIASSACVGGVLCQILLQNKIIEHKIDAIQKKMSEVNNPESTENKEMLRELTELEEEKVSLTSKKKELTGKRKLLNQQLTALQKSANRLAGKDGYESVSDSISKKEVEIAAIDDELGYIADRIAEITNRKRPLAAERKKRKDKFGTYAEQQKTVTKLKTHLKSEEELIDDTKRAAEKYREIFGEGNFYVELQYHGFKNEAEAMSKLSLIADQLDLPTVATNDAHFAHNSESEEMARRLNMSQRFGGEWQPPVTGDDQLYIKSDEELSAALENIIPPEKVSKAMQGIGSIVARCDVVFPTEAHYPVFSLPEGETSSAEYLRKLAIAGIPKRYPRDTWTEECQKRLDYELNVIHRMGFDDYHLIVQDFVSYGRKLALDNPDNLGVGVGPGRGSAVGSLVCYLIGITSVDPMKHDLLFERYLNIERVTMPDIDTDYSNAIREDIIRYAQDKYGKKGVCYIETDNKQPPKASVLAIGRIFPELKPYTEKINSSITAKDNTHFNKVGEDGKTLCERLKQTFTAPEYHKVIDYASLIEGSLINHSSHAAGIVISDSHDISDYLPLRKDKSGNWVCQCTKEEVEGSAHLLKMDFLGLRNLDIGDSAIKMIYRNHNVRLDFENLPIETAVFKNIFSTGKTNSVFQFESPGMKQMLREFKPDCMEDLILLVAAYRPGPMQYLPEIKAVKQGTKKAKYIIPEMADILAPTYGKPIYQEQIQAIFHRFAGFSLGEADIIRRIMSKKKKELLLDPKTNYKGRFIDGLTSRGAKQEEAEVFWTELLNFAAYAFNKSHAAAYAYIAYNTAYLKYYYPAEFMASVLRMLTDASKYPMIIKEAKEFGVNVKAPSITESGLTFDTSANGSTLIFGISSIKGIGKSGGEVIAERSKRNFNSFKDFIKRCPVNKNHLELLIRCGAFDEFCENRQSLLIGYEKLIDLCESIKKKKGTLALAEEEIESITEKQKREAQEKKILRLKSDIYELEELYSYEMLPDAVDNHERKLNDERELLGYYVSGHPMDVWKREDTAAYICDAEAGRNKICGVVRDYTILHRKKDNAPFAKFTLEDETGSVETLCFSDKFTEAVQEILKEGAAVMLDGEFSIETAESDGDEDKIQFFMNDLRLLEKRERYDEIIKKRVSEEFGRKRYCIKVNSVIQWPQIEEILQNYKDDEKGIHLLVDIEGYRKAYLAYKVSSQVLTHGLYITAY